MRNIKLTLVLALAIGAPSNESRAQYTGLDPALATAVKAYDEAQMKVDAKALEELIADDYLILRANGTVGDKRLLIAMMAGEGVKNDRYVVEKPFQRIFGDITILGGWVHATGTDHGKPFMQNIRFADTWNKRNGKWRVVFTAVALSDSQ